MLVNVAFALLLSSTALAAVSKRSVAEWNAIRDGNKDWNIPRDQSQSTFLRKRDPGRPPSQWNARSLDGSLLTADHTDESAHLGARAEPGRWENLNGTVKGYPCAMSWAPKHMSVYYQDKTNVCKVKTYNYQQSGWSSWENLGGYLDSPPSVCSYGEGHAGCYVKGDDDYCWYKGYEGGKWGSWYNIGGDMKYEPSSCSWGYGHMAVYASSKQNECYYKPYNNQWGSWYNLGGYLNGPPKVVTYAYGYMYIFVRGDDNQMWCRKYDDKNGWGRWESQGGYLAGSVGAYAEGGKVTTVVKGDDGNAWTKTYDTEADKWNSWENLGGNDVKWNPDVVAYEDKKEVYYTGEDNGMYRKVYEGDKWNNDWEYMGGGVDSKPSPCKWGDDYKQVDIYLTGKEGTCQRCW